MLGLMSVCLKAGEFQRTILDIYVSENIEATVVAGSILKLLTIYDIYKGNRWYTNEQCTLIPNVNAMVLVGEY